MRTSEERMDLIFQEQKRSEKNNKERNNAGWKQDV
mgnify:CR=1 FL=1